MPAPEQCPKKRASQSPAVPVALDPFWSEPDPGPTRPFPFGTIRLRSEEPHRR
jgi:hypothetical protein